MASFAALALRRANTMNRLNAATSAASAAFGVDAPVSIHPAALRDPQIAEIARLDSVADLLERITATLSVPSEPVKTPEPNGDVVETNDPPSDPPVDPLAEESENDSDVLEELPENTEDDHADSTGVPVVVDEPIPADFPGAKTLQAAGFKNLSEIRAQSREDLIALNGIAEKTADAIIDRLAA